MNINEADLAKATMEFLKRVDLKGIEVQAFSGVMHWLATKAEPMSPMPMPAVTPVDPMPHADPDHDLPEAVAEKTAND